MSDDCSFCTRLKKIVSANETGFVALSYRPTIAGCHCTGHRGNYFMDVNPEELNPRWVAIDHREAKQKVRAMKKSGNSSGFYFWVSPPKKRAVIAAFFGRTPKNRKANRAA